MIGLLAPAWTLRWLLRRLPPSVVAPLDAWSHRMAQRRAAKRRRLAQANR